VEYHEFNNGSDAARGGSGETFRGVRRRMGDAVREIVEQHRGESVGVVSHGGATRAYVTEVLGLDYPQRNRLGLLGNTAYARMAFTMRGPGLVSWNLAPHLNDPETV
jgi:broad specificity phosphatase PhoE